MQLLRDDLVISPSREAGKTVYLVHDPRSGESFSFGEPEHFLLQGLRKPYDEAKLIEKFNSTFGFESTTNDFQSFLTILADWGLLQEFQSAQRVLRLASDRWRQPPSTVSQPAETLRKNETSVAPETMNVAATKSARQSSESELDSPEIDFFSTLDDDLDEINEDNFQIPGSKRRRSQQPGVQQRGQADGSHDQHWSWFCPDPFFAMAARTLYPLRYLRYPLLLFFIIGITALIFNFKIIKDDWFTRILANINLLEHIAFSIITVNLVSQLTEGIIARHFDVRVLSFGIRFSFGIIPRFDVIIDDISQLSKPARLWITAAPLLAKLTTFCVGITMFLMTRPMGTLLPTAALMLSSVSFFSLLLDANPLINKEGYRLLTHLLDMPYLRQQANRAFLGLFKKDQENAPFQNKQEDLFALRAFALASFVFLFLVLGLVLVFAAYWLEWHYQGTGVFIFLVVMVCFILYSRGQIKSRKAKLQAKAETVRASRQSQRPAFRQVPGAVRGPATVERKKTARKPRSKWMVAFRYLLLALFIGCLFLPYPYETGGSSVVLPTVKQQIFAETDGIVEKVFFEGGEWVAKGTPIAQLAKHKQEKDVLTTRSEIQRNRSDLEKLLTTPTKEELDLAMQQLEVARVQYKYSADKAKRLEKLYANGNVSLEDYEKAKGDMDVNQQQVLEKQANLLAVKNQVNVNQIQAARLVIKKLEQELSFYEEQLRRTTLRMPIDGRIITMDLRNLENKYLEESDLFAEVEDINNARVEVSIPESDIGEVVIGDTVRLKIWAYPTHIFLGKVSEIYPAASSTDYGKVIQVVSLFPNEKGLLKSGMTGYAKVEGSEMFVIEAFTRALVRFVTIEAWSWIP